MIIIKYILKNHLIPFLFSVFILLSVFILQYMVKMADRLVGKGLSAWIIVQLVTYSLAWMVVLVVPMAVLIASLMAFGSMSQNNEIAILKATGVSLYRMMVPPLFASVFIALFLVHFNNNIYPDANHALRILLEDISRKKPTLSLVPGVFSQEVPNYSILVREIDQNTNQLKQITIYDYSRLPKVNIVTASTGKIYFSPNQKKLMMDLYSGEIHESDNTEKKSYRKLRFIRHKIAMPAEQFAFEQSASGGQRGDRELGAYQLKKIADSLEIIQTRYFKDYNSRIRSLLKHNYSPLDNNNGAGKFVYLRAQQKIRNDQASMNDILLRIDFNDRDIDRYWVEIHKKYSLPFACIIFVLIGAPLGTMMRKGGFGMAAGMSLIFFLVYWAFLIGGEKLADRGLLSPMTGIWSANLFLGLLGIYLMIKSAREKVTINFDFFNKLLPKSWRFQQENDENP
ncbi:MAG: YjgP/YjgQ family permease [Ignavibacteriae bacterium HGW-Ignavibacteriae-3]|nr:MAG: YjgP/YjgQ family permease [Ignavibacteriae bacterium HGW-Ignavibacteriae-3]